MPFKSRNIILNVLSLIIVLFSASCSSELSDQNKEKEIIKETLNKMWAAIENENIEAYARYVHPEFSQFGEYDSIIKLGKDNEVQGVANWIKDSDNIQTEMINPIVTINGNVAWITYYWSDNGTTDGIPFASKGKSTRIFVKENNKWLCIHGHYTLLPPPN